MTSKTSKCATCESDEKLFKCGDCGKRFCSDCIDEDAEENGIAKCCGCADGDEPIFCSLCSSGAWLMKCDICKRDICRECAEGGTESQCCECEKDDDIMECNQCGMERGINGMLQCTECDEYSCKSQSCSNLYVTKEKGLGDDDDDDDAPYKCNSCLQNRKKKCIVDKCDVISEISKMQRCLWCKKYVCSQHKGEYMIYNACQKCLEDTPDESDSDNEEKEPDSVIHGVSDANRIINIDEKEKNNVDSTVPIEIQDKSESETQNTTNLKRKLNIWLVGSNDTTVYTECDKFEIRDSEILGLSEIFKKRKYSHHK
jgi:hypothetical protein